MTDEEIEKAIELCESENLPCQECAYWKISIQGYNCRNALIRDMHDYINRLKAENEKLKDTLNAVENYEINLRGNLEECVDKIYGVRLL